MESTRCLIWHGFRGLDSGDKGLVPASKLKVFTSNVLAALGIPGDDEDDELHEYCASVASTYAEGTRNSAPSLSSSSLLSPSSTCSSSSSSSASLLSFEISPTDSLNSHSHLATLFHQSPPFRQESPMLTTTLTTKLSFNEYFSVLDSKLGSSSSKSSQSCGSDMSKVEEICWLLWTKKHFQTESNVLEDSDRYKLFLVYCQAAECLEGTPFGYVLDKEEAVFLCRLYTEAQGNRWTSDHVPRYITQDHYCFMEFLRIIEEELSRDVSRQCIREAVGEVYDVVVKNVLKKGMLQKRGHPLGMWKERWFVLRGSHLAWYVLRSEDQLKGETQLSPVCKVEMLPGEIKDKMHTYCNLFQLVTPGKTYVLSGTDQKTKQQWIRALTTAIEHTSRGSADRIQTEQFAVRRARRRCERAEREEEQRKRERQLLREVEDRIMREEMEREEERMRREVMEERRRQQEEDMWVWHQKDLQSERKKSEQLEKRLLEEMKLREEELKERVKLERITLAERLQLVREKERVQEERTAREVAESRLLQEMERGCEEANEEKTSGTDCLQNVSLDKRDDGC